jgi:hypothetical protein
MAIPESTRAWVEMLRMVIPRRQASNRPGMRKHLQLLTCLTLAIDALTGCAADSRVGVGGPITFPLPPCDAQKEVDCTAALFASPDHIGPRYPATFPQRYLELWNEDVRSEYCSSRTPAATAGESTEACLTRLQALSKYLNPAGRPPSDKIGVALEGGGNKSAPFNLGVLAGLQEIGALPNSVGAIASVSGGSYAASFLFNRLFDQSSHDAGAGAGDYADWFRSCIPDEFADDTRPAANSMFANFKSSAKKLPVCGEQHKLPTESPCDPFLASYRHQGHVWMQPDLIMGTSANGLKRSDGFYDAWDPIANTAALFVESLVALPWQTLSRSIFRWPGNSSPTKLAYTDGLEREYGYSPSDWQAIQKCNHNAITALRDDAALVADVRSHRLQERTMQALGGALKKVQAPEWIIGSSSPGPITATEWLGVPTRDPIRHQFELTVSGYGSGIHGYAKVWPFSGDGLLESDLLAPGSLFPSTNSMPIVEAVVASAAFFDDDQSALSVQPERLWTSTGQHFLDLGWYQEIPNFNASDASRIRQRQTPYPLYLHWTDQYAKEPYIHLHDGGNSDNSAIMPLLRRGYRTIVYAHGNQDSQALFPEICHLKNQLELDGHYYIQSSTLEDITTQFNLRLATPGPRRFGTYLDQICTEQLDESDLATFDANAARTKPEQRAPSVAKLLCGRIGDAARLEEQVVGGKTIFRTDPDPAYTPCQEFTRKFDAKSASHVPISSDCLKPTPCTYRIVTDLFYRWAGDSIRFEVYRGDALAHPGGTPGRPETLPFSTIFAVVPALSAHDVAQQLADDASLAGGGQRNDPAPILPGGNCDSNPWRDYCDQAPALQKRLRINACAGPGRDSVLSTLAANAVVDPITPCSALAHIVATRCDRHPHPAFPQDNIYLETWNTSYTTYAAYFDLGRYQAQRAFRDWQSPSDHKPQSCPAPAQLATGSVRLR